MAYDVDGLAGSAVGVGVPLPPRILNITVPQVGHFPFIALRPFFIVSSTASIISFLALHLTQYPSGIKNWLPRSSMPRGSYCDSLESGPLKRQMERGLMPKCCIYKYL